VTDINNIMQFVISDLLGMSPKSLRLVACYMNK